jgi:hypothetical protein
MSEYARPNMPYRFPRKGYGKSQWLTRKQKQIADTLGVEWFPTVHRADEVEVECPAPEVCGWFCSQEDEQKIKRLEAIK